MLYYLLFWTILGFIFHFYIIFGTNLLIGGPAQNCCFLPISVFRRNGISNGMKPSGAWFLERTWSRRLGVQVKKQPRQPREGRALPPYRARHPVLRAPRAATNVLLSPIYTHLPRNHQKRPWKTISTTVTFCIREIPSWSLRRRSPGGLLHQHHSPSDDLWVVYHRPSGP